MGFSLDIACRTLKEKSIPNFCFVDGFQFQFVNTRKMFHRNDGSDYSFNVVAVFESNNVSGLNVYLVFELRTSDFNRDAWTCILS
jgi:hypothetical protein